MLILKNEKGNRQRDLNEAQLRGRFTQLKDSLATNLADNRGLDTALKEICHHLSNLPHIGSELPKTWVRVRQALENDPRHTITLENYLQLCQENGFTRNSDALQLSDYLHDLGICLHFQDDDLLCKTLILKPTWGTDAVYKVLDNPEVVNNQGCFQRADLDRIWAAAEYQNLRPELLQLMMRFQLCYEIPNAKQRYIAPQLLPASQPRYDWNEAENLILRYTYEFMPKGILSRFIVALHKDIATNSENRQIVWKTGVLLQKDDTLAEVIEFYEKREIKIRLTGRHKRDLLAIVTHEFKKIHDSFQDRLKYQTLIPCNCPTCKPSQDPHAYPLQVLKKFMSDGEEIQCQKSYAMVDPRSLIDDSIGHPQAGVEQKIPDLPDALIQINIDASRRSQHHSGSGDNVGRDKNTKNS